MPDDHSFSMGTKDWPSLLQRRVKADREGGWGYPRRNKPSEDELGALVEWFQATSLEEKCLEIAFNRGWSDKEDLWEQRAALEIIREELRNTL